VWNGVVWSVLGRSSGTGKVIGSEGSGRGLLGGLLMNLRGEVMMIYEVVLRPESGMGKRVAMVRTV
jgi:hypothetical protein